MFEKKEIAIIGAGASGLMAAVVLGRAGNNVKLLERDSRVGKKILVTGNGRCNLTNIGVCAEVYNNPDFVRPTIEKYGCSDVRDLFKTLGLYTYVDVEGRVFPATNAASSVVDVLRAEMVRLGVVEQLGFEAVSIKKGKQFTIYSEDGQKVNANQVILCMGGSTKLAQELEIETIKPSYILGPIQVEESLKSVSGLRVHCQLKINMNASKTYNNEEHIETGELLFKDNAISGIVSFNLSRFIIPTDSIYVDLLPGIAHEELIVELKHRAASWNCCVMDRSLLDGLLLPRIGDVSRKLGNISKKSSIEDLVDAIKNMRLTVKSLPTRKTAQVMRGGINTDIVDPRTFEIKCRSGIYAIGEALNIDGPSGGYNLHWAFASALSFSSW